MKVSFDGLAQLYRPAVRAFASILTSLLLCSPFVHGHANCQAQARWIAPAQKNNDCSQIEEIGARARQNLLDDKEEKSFAEYNEAISKNVACSPLYIGRGVILFRRGEHARAMADFTKAIELDPKNKTTYMFRGVFLQKLKDDDKAVADFTKNIELCTKENDCSSAVYAARGESYSNLKEFDKAIQDYTKAISIEPDDADTYQLRALAYFKGKAQLTPALADVEKAISLNDKKGAYYEVRGSILFLQAISEHKPALVNAGLQDLARAIELEPNEYKYYDVRAFIYEKIGETEKADADRKRADDLKGRRFLQKSP